MTKMTWSEIGVWEFMSCFEGLRGVVKVHPSDFVVNELRGSDGSVVDMSETDSESQPAPEDSPFVKFTLHKTRRDTMDVILEVAEALGISSKKFSIAGLKDKWAVTTQEVTVYGVTVEEVQNVLLGGNAVLGNCRLAIKKLHHGNNTGNRFRIVVRGVREQPKHHVQAALTALQSSGFINYIGLQRFQYGDIKSEVVGRAYLRWDYTAAVDALLAHGDPTCVRHNNVTEGKRSWLECRDASTAQRLLPFHLRTIHQVLAAISRLSSTKLSLEEKCRISFLQLPWELRLLWAHSYFDRVWNLMASERIRRYGTAVVCGDLLLSRDDKANLRGHEQIPVRVTTEAQAAASSIADVVLPLMGDDAILPDNALATFYRQYLAFDGMDDMFEIEKSNKPDHRHHIRGALRHLTAVPQRLNWKLVPKAGGMEQLYQDSHLDIGVSENIIAACRPEMTQMCSDTALQLDFELPSGSYATVMLREVLENDACVKAPAHIRFEDLEESDEHINVAHIRFEDLDECDELTNVHTTKTTKTSASKSSKHKRKRSRNKNTHADS